MLPVRFIPFGVVLALAAISLTVAVLNGGWLTWSLAAIPTALAALGVRDLLQTRHTLLRNYPVVGHARYLLESIRPEIRQYFVEDDLEGRPFNRERRSLVYQRAKGAKDYDPFGSELDVREVGYEWIAHSIAPIQEKLEAPRVRVGEGRCSQPYDLSPLNVSAMSYGSLGASAVRALGRGAREEGFAHNTGEGGISRYHLETGADLVWQVGTGYFGCRADDGSFDPEAFRERARQEQVKMIELKLSQGAKPGHGGILPAHKVTPEIAEARGVPEGESCLSPPGHSAFGTPLELVELVDEMRELSGGKPVGIKLCIGLPTEFLAILKAMLESGKGPDFITVDGGEGGTGAAPPEFGDHVGMPLEEGLAFAQRALTATGLRDRVVLIASGKMTSAMDIVRAFALGADATAAARSFMLSIGCIQAQLCHTNHCPVGVATLDPLRNRGLDPTDKGQRAARFHRETMKSLMELCAAAGWRGPGEARADRIWRRVEVDRVRTLDEIHGAETPESLLAGTAGEALQRDFDAARAGSWAPGAIG